TPDRMLRRADRRDAAARAASPRRQTRSRGALCQRRDGDGDGHRDTLEKKCNHEEHEDHAWLPFNPRTEDALCFCISAVTSQEWGLKIAVIAGDGIGKDVTAEAVKVLSAVGE